MQHFHFADNDFHACVILLYELLNGLCQVYSSGNFCFHCNLIEVLFIFSSGHILVFIRLSCTVVKALLF
jgi:hypothetical protein